MKAVEYDLILQAGSNPLIQWTYTNSDGTAVDLSTHSATLKLYREIGQDAFLTLNSGTEITLGASDNNIAIQFTRSQMADLKGKGFYRFVVTSGGVDTRLVQGAFLVEL